MDFEMIFSSGGGSDAGIVTDHLEKALKRRGKNHQSQKVTEYIKYFL